MEPQFKDCGNKVRKELLNGIILKLQWSRSSKTAETKRITHWCYPSPSASMEPQFKDCGNRKD